MRGDSKKLNFNKDAVHAVEFYRMSFVNALGTISVSGNKANFPVYHGAVVFGRPRRKGCEVLKVATPMPKIELLYETLGQIHSAPLRERMIFTEWKPDQVIAALEKFCQQGLPLPDVFDPQIAHIENLTEFQSLIYSQACQIPHGETRAYTWLAARVKKYGAERAVGRAMRTNPFPLFIPCHRVVKKDGNLGGYMGTTSPESWQLGLKRALLEMEGQHQQPTLFSLCNPLNGNSQPELSLA